MIKLLFRVRVRLSTVRTPVFAIDPLKLHVSHNESFSVLFCCIAVLIFILYFHKRYIIILRWCVSW